MTEVAAKPIGKSVQFLASRCRQVPVAAVILGSGVNVLEDLDNCQTIAYDEAFGISPSVAGHRGSLSLGYSGDKLICVLRGRFHLFEGHDWEVVTTIARVMVEWGVPALYLTNAAGGLNRQFAVGDLMVLTGFHDHLNRSYAQTGLLPALSKPSRDCRTELTDHILAAGERLSRSDTQFRPLQTGVYAACLGPNYETLAEIEMLKKLGADAVGMSTVPELITAEGTKTKAAAVSVITNVWNPDELVGGHEEVLHAASGASLRLDKLLRAAIAAG